MNPSHKLVSDEIKLFLEEIHKRFDEFDARMEQRFSRTMAAMEQRKTVVEPRIGSLEQIGITQRVVADNWGGLFETAPLLEEHVYDPAATDSALPPTMKGHQDAAVVPDNWGGLFDRSIHIPEERKLAVQELILPLPRGSESSCLGSVLEPDLACPDWLAVDVSTGYNSFDTTPDELIPDPAAARTKFDATEDPRWHAAALTKVAPKYSLPQIDLDRLYELGARRELKLRMEPIVCVKLQDATGTNNPRLTTLPVNLDTPRGGNELVFIGANIQQLHNNVAFDDPGPLCCVRLGPVDFILHAVPLGGYDGSLDDDPASGFAHFDAPLDRAVGRVAQVLATAAALCTDAVGAAGGGLLAWVEAAGLAQFSCSTVYLAGDCWFSNVSAGALWEDELISWGGDPTNLSDSILIDVPVVFVQRCALDMVFEPWQPPPMPVEFVCGSAAIRLRPTPWPPPDYMMAVLQLCVNCLDMRGCLHWNAWKCRTYSEISELHPDIDNSSGVFAVQCTSRGSLLGSVKMQLSCGDWEPYFQWKATREAMNTDIFATSQESVHCSTYKQNFCQELIYLGTFTRGCVPVSPMLSRGKGFKLRMLNKDDSLDAVLLVFANTQDPANAMSAAEITDQIGLTESSMGDVLIFLDMIRYKELTHFVVNNFIEEVFLKDIIWVPGFPKPMSGYWETCSHVGGHKYGGTVIILSSDAKGEPLAETGTDSSFCNSAAAGECCQGNGVSNLVFLGYSLDAQSMIWDVCREMLMLDIGFLTTSTVVQFGTQCLNLPTSAPTSVIQSSAQARNVVFSHAKFPWDPGGSRLLDRLGGKPNLKERGMLGMYVGPLTLWAMGLSNSACFSESEYKRGNISQRRASNNYSTEYFFI